MARTLIPRLNLNWPLSSFETEMGDLMSHFFGNREDGGSLMQREVFAPRINVVEDQTQYEISVELPGMKSEDFHVEMEGGELRISGEKKFETEEKGKTFHRVERHFGSFHRLIPLPSAVAADKITAQYKDGVLTVKVPKTEEAKPRKIDVTT
jgi:HSP20 family protein